MSCISKEKRLLSLRLHPECTIVAVSSSSHLAAVSPQRKSNLRPGDLLHTSGQQSRPPDPHPEGLSVSEKAWQRSLEHLAFGVSWFYLGLHRDKKPCSARSDKVE
jgi:hypothetical protein